MRSKIAILALALTALPSSAFPCAALSGTPVSWTREAEVIIRARAAALAPSPSRVQFEVLEVLKGQLPAEVVEFDGRLTGHDDPNDLPVPYGMVRREGRSGNCFALSYKPGGEYLLILRTRNGELTPYWASLGATNEQLFGVEDPWLAWVRQQLK